METTSSAITPPRAPEAPRVVEEPEGPSDALVTCGEGKESILEGGVSPCPRLVIYVAGPLGAPENWNANALRAIDAGLDLITRGHVPIVPHLTIHMSRRAADVGMEIGYECWLSQDFEIIRRCDAILYLAPSPGADRELALARELGLRVFTCFEDVPEVSR